MNLSEIGLNRFLYKDGSLIDKSNAASSMDKDIGGANVSTTTGNGTSEGVEPGGNPIQNTLLQSSGSADRVEINPNDEFLAYNNEEVVVRINKDGIWAVNGEIENLTSENAEIEDLKVNNTFTYQGVVQPVMYCGEVQGNGVGVSLPAGWTVTTFAVNGSTPDPAYPAYTVNGQYYIITHNLNTDPYFVNITPRSGHNRGRVAHISTNFFVVSFQETNYVQKSFPFNASGPNGADGGGTANVSGNVSVRRVKEDAPYGEIAVQTSFQFVLFKPPTN